MTQSNLQQGFQYAVDVVFCIDVTGSMQPVIDQVKEGALSFHARLQEAMNEKRKQIAQLRVKVIAFRDFGDNASDAILESPFYTLPEESGAFEVFVKPLRAGGGGDAPESGLEALALAVVSDWERSMDRRRHIIVLWTDAPAHPIGTHAAVAGHSYPRNIPTTNDELFEAWGYDGSQTAAMEFAAKRLILFTPDVLPWSTINEEWDNIIYVPTSGDVVRDTELGEVIEAVANSV
jgi:hypothetical protein